MSPFLLLVIFNFGVVLGFIFHRLLQNAEKEVSQNENCYESDADKIPFYRGSGPIMARQRSRSMN